MEQNKINLNLTIDATNKVARILVDSFVDSSARLDNKSPLYVLMYSCDSVNFDTYFADSVLSTKSLLTACYDYLKTLQEFDQATDI